MKKKLVFESLSERKQRGLEKAPSEIKLNRDFIWNEVISWLIEYFKTSDSPFTYEEMSYSDHMYLIFENAKGMKFYCERKWSFFDYYGNHTVNFSVGGRELLFSYKISPHKFNDPEHFVSAYKSGQYKNYAIASAKVNKEYVKGGMEEYKNLPNKRKLWKNRIDTKEYLKDTSFQAIVTGFKVLSYSEAIALPKLIIKTLKADEKFKAFIKGKDEMQAKRASELKALKGDLSVDTIIKYLASTKPEHKVIKSDNAGPHATTGTSEFVDTWNISKLSQKFPKFEDFVHVNIEKIFKGLQNNIYKHSLGYYKFKDYYVDEDTLEIQATSTTYYN